MPYYKYHLFFCTNFRDDGAPCCQQFDARSAREHMKQQVKEQGLDGKDGVRVNNAGCLGRCELGPVLLIYPEGTCYTYVDWDDLYEILSRHILQGKPVERLLLK